MGTYGEWGDYFSSVESIKQIALLSGRGIFAKRIINRTSLIRAVSMDMQNTILLLAKCLVGSARVSINNITT